MKLWPAMIFILLALNALFVGATLYFSFSGAGPGVEPSYDSSGESYSRVQARQQRNRRLAWNITLSADRIDPRTVLLRVRAFDADAVPLENARVELHAFHALATSEKLHATLDPAQPGLYSQAVTMPRSGPWIVLLRVTRGEGDHAQVYELRQKLPVRSF